MTITDALRKYTDDLMALPGVVGTAQGVCQARPCIKVYVIERTPRLETQIHRILKGLPYRIEETGPFHPH